MTTDFLNELERARERLVARRRKLVQMIAQTEGPEYAERLAQVQTAIEAVDRARADEMHAPLSGDAGNEMSKNPE